MLSRPPPEGSLSRGRGRRKHATRPLVKWPVSWSVPCFRRPFGTGLLSRWRGRRKHATRQSRDIRPPTAPPVDGTGSGRTGGSYAQPPLAVGCERQARLQIFSGQLGKVGQQLVGRHAPREVLQDVLHGHPHATDARLPAPLARFDGNPRSPLVVHRKAPPTQDLAEGRGQRQLIITEWIPGRYRPHEPRCTCSRPRKP